MSAAPSHAEHVDPAGDRDAILDALADPDVDRDGAVERVLALAEARRSKRRNAFGSATALVIVALITAMVLGRGPNTTAVVTDTERTTPTTRASTTSTTAVPVATTAVPPTMAPPLTLDPTGGVDSGASAAPVPVEPTTTTAVAAPLRAHIPAAPVRVRAGEAVGFDVSWSSEGLRSPAPHVSVDWGDPVVAAEQLPAPGCDEPPAPREGSTRVEFRYASTGRHRVTVTVADCAGEPAAAPITMRFEVEVVAPVSAGQTARIVVITSSSTIAGDPPLDATSGTFVVAVDGAPESYPIAERIPQLRLRHGAVPASVITLVNAAGTLGLTWPGGVCAASTTIPDDTDAATPSIVVLTPDCTGGGT